MFRLYLTGAPASGKSTMGRALAESADGRYLSYGELLTERLAVPNQQELRRRSASLISPDDVAQADAEVRATISEFGDTSNLIVDSHAVTRESYGFRAIPYNLPTWQAMQFTHIVCLLVPGTVIHDRITRDSGGRPLLTPEQFDQHSILQSSFAAAYSHSAGIPVAFIEANRPVGDVVASIAKFVGA